MSDDYGYINARIRAMRSFLLKEENYLEALRQHTLEEFCGYLSGRPSYTDDLAQVSVQAAKSRYTEALRTNLCRTFRKIFKFCSGEPRELIHIILMPYDIYNLKTIVRGILNYKDKDEIIKSLIPAGRWDLEFLRHLIESKDLRALADNLSASVDSDFERGFAALIRDYTQESPLEILENGLSEFYFKKASEYLRNADGDYRVLLDYLLLKADFSNILLALEKISEGLNTKTGFIPAGKLKQDFLEEMLRLGTVEGASKIFENSVYPWLADEILDSYKRTRRLSSLERLFKKRIFNFCFKAYRQNDPLSISISLGFINFKEGEVDNLRLIGESIYFGIPSDSVRQELIFAG